MWMGKSGPIREVAYKMHLETEKSPTPAINSLNKKKDLKQLRQDWLTYNWWHYLNPVGQPEGYQENPVCLQYREDKFKPAEVPW